MSGPNMDYLALSLAANARLSSEEQPQVLSPLIYPTPADRFINVENVGDLISGFSLSDILDKSAGKLSFEKCPAGYRIDVVSLPEGIYLLQVHHPKKNITRKIYISR